MTFLPRLLPLLMLATMIQGTNRLSAADGPIAGTWPQWRGPDRDGHANADAWPDHLQSPTLTQRWRIELPPSYSGPVVSADNVFATFTRDEKYEGACALDRHSGQQVWKAEWPGALQVAPLGSSMGSWIRATPAYDGDALFVAGMPDVLVCLDARTGTERWRADFHQRYATPLPELGFVCSPLVVDDAVYVQTADSFVKVDKRTGESRWRCLERDEKASLEGRGQGSYSSPAFAVIHGRPQLLVANIDAIAGVEPSSGEVLWKRVLDSYDQGCILAPIVYREGIFTSTRASKTGFYPLSFRDGQFTMTDGWKNDLSVYMSSPIIIGDAAYLHLANGRFACVDLQNGNVNWISRPFGKYCSMVANKNQILALTNEGELLLIHADPDQFVLADTRTIASDETWGHLAVAGPDLYIRERNAITAYRWQ